MSVDSAQLRNAMQLIHRASGGLVECCDLDGSDMDVPEEELNALYSSIAEEKKLSLWFPGEEGSVDWPIDDFVRQASDCENLTAGEVVTLRTRNRAIQLVTPVSELAHAVVYHDESLSIQTADGAKVRLTNRSLPVGVYASRTVAYAKHCIGSLSSYHAVEVDFSEFGSERSERSELDIIDSYLFELASSHDVVFEKGNFIYGADADPWWTSERPSFRLRPLEGSNEGIGLFLAAAQVSDPSLRFFSFYKVLEHFAPTVLSLEVHECLRKKLDSSAALSPSGKFIRELLQISKAFDQRKNEREFIKCVLLSGVDLVGLNTHVPKSLRRELTYETPRKELEQYARDLAECICATRNQVVHSKATYTSHGTECRPEELSQLTQFMESAAAELIRWYNRLPKHQRAELGFE